MSALANRLIQKGFLKTDLIIDAFSEINRVEFLPERFSVIADDNVALPIGHGQTAPAPSVVAFMLELLEPKRGNNVLVCGAGSGWVAVLMSYIVGSKGHVTAIDDVEGLVAQARANVAKYNFIARDNITQLHHGSFDNGHPAEAPYDCVLIMRSLAEVPADIVAQTAPSGHVVAPINDTVTYFEKNGHLLEADPFPGVKFSQS